MGSRLQHSTDKDISVEQLNALRKAMGQNAHRMDLWPQLSECLWRQFLQGAHAVHSVWDEGHLVGYSYTTPDNRVCELQDLLVHPTYQGRNLGRGLVQRVIESSRKGKFDAIYLTPGHSVQGRGGKVGFYEKLGFYECGGKLRFDL